MTRYSILRFVSPFFSRVTNLARCGCVGKEGGTTRGGWTQATHVPPSAAYPRPNAQAGHEPLPGVRPSPRLGLRQLAHRYGAGGRHPPDPASPPLPPARLPPLPPALPP